MVMCTQGITIECRKAKAGIQSMGVVDSGIVKDSLKR